MMLHSTLRCQETLCVLILINFLLFTIDGEPQGGNGNYFLKAAKNVPRIGRSNNSNKNIDEMGKFFMKASKSVPRIGRRNQLQNEYLPLPNPNPYQFVYDDFEQPRNMDKRRPSPIWSELAERFEYEPELFASPEVLMQLDQELGDDPSAYEWNPVRVRRSSHPGEFNPASNNKIKL